MLLCFSLIQVLNFFFAKYLLLFAPVVHFLCWGFLLIHRIGLGGVAFECMSLRGFYIPTCISNTIKNGFRYNVGIVLLGADVKQDFAHVFIRPTNRCTKVSILDLSVLLLDQVSTPDSPQHCDT